MNTKIFVTMIVLMSVFSAFGEDRLPEISLDFTVPKIEIVKDTTKMVKPEHKEIVAISAISVERTNPKYNPIPFRDIR